VAEVSAQTDQLRNPAFVVAAGARKPVLNVWQWGAESVAMRCAQAEQMLSVAVDPSGVWVAGGAVSGTLYVWRAGDGALVRTTRAHLKAISAVLWANSGTSLLTGSEDTTVRAWTTSSLVDCDLEVDPSYRPKPRLTWRGHTLAVTSLRRAWTSPASPASPSSSAAAALTDADADVVASTSLDRTIRLFRPGSGAVLAVVSLPSPIYCCSVTTSSSHLVAGAADGAIYQVALRATAGASTGLSLAAASSGPAEPPAGSLSLGPTWIAAATTTTASPGEEADSAAHAGAHTGDGSALFSSVGSSAAATSAGLSVGETRTMLGHAAAVHDIVVTADGARVISASADGTARVWDMLSGQQIRVLKHGRGAAASAASSSSSSAAAMASVMPASGGRPPAVTSLLLAPRSSLYLSGSRTDPLTPLAALAKHAVPMSQRRSERKRTAGIDTTPVPAARSALPAVGGGVQAPSMGLVAPSGGHAADSALVGRAVQSTGAAAAAERPGEYLEAISALRAGDAAAALNACGLTSVGLSLTQRGRGGRASLEMVVEPSATDDDQDEGDDDDDEEEEDDDDEEEAEAADAAPDSKRPAPTETEAALQAELEGLRDENARWKAVNGKLLAKLQQSGVHV
jgi:WD40 repeat protein